MAAMRGEADWSLTDEQFAFFERYQPLVGMWQKSDNDVIRRAIDELAHCLEFKTLFGNMSFDEAYDRYEVAKDYEADGLTEKKRATAEAGLVYRAEHGDPVENLAKLLSSLADKDTWEQVINDPDVYGSEA